MKIAYGKLGRSIPLSLEEASNVGGDIEVVRMLYALLGAGHDVHLVGRNRGTFSQRMLERSVLVNHWGPGNTFQYVPEASRRKDEVFQKYDEYIRESAHKLPKFDAWLIWLGQHGTSLHPMPAVQPGKVGYTNPMISDVNYGYPLVAMVNELKVAPFWLCPDPRNMIKFRDLASPDQRPILAQFNTSKNNSFWSDYDCKLRSGSTKYIYSGIELLAAPPLENGDRPPLVPPNQTFGLLVNEGYNNLGNKGRLHFIQTWLKGIEFEIFGTWSPESQAALGRKISPVPLADVTNTLRRWRATMTFPATATGWATAKPWECFKAGTICFKHPEYDSQHHIYSYKHMPEELRQFLCPPTMSGLRDRLERIEDDNAWRYFVKLQYDYFVASHERLEGGMKIVKEAIGA